MHVVELPGTGRPLLFIHGLGCAASYDYPVVAAHPALSHRRRVLIDLAGHGYAGAPSEGSYSIEDMSVLIVELASTLDDEVARSGKCLPGRSSR